MSAGTHTRNSRLTFESAQTGGMRHAFAYATQIAGHGTRMNVSTSRYTYECVNVTVHI